MSQSHNITCGNCGATNRATARFCGQCRAPLHVPEQETVPLPPPSASPETMRLPDDSKTPFAERRTFCVKKTKGRQGRNPATGQPITIPPGYRLGFKVSKSWKTGMMLRQREQAKDKVKVHTHKEAPKAKAAARKVTKPPAKAKVKKK